MPEIEKGEYDEMNNHLPKLYTVKDYGTQLFYCIITNNVSGLRILINKLEELDIGLPVISSQIRTVGLGDTLLTYAVRYGKLDIVRFLLSVGVDSNVTNYNNDTPISIAMKNSRYDIARAIMTMQR
ncbi:ankyrin repeat-containing protein [Ehrlichia ruminantium]|uniref:Ankyrin repeat-containing protein n=2 Tax=Ehrlichia ruminantium TaxID=779 RepID=A0A170T6X8_EHRRU|nr:ankyrin repeat domain-containing protein [Ehrlichia ruminantium]GAT75516.1 ankyrin repeat-containing protein [Ehrlichia ruminantium]GAT77499.1 ankyrin repeat-containing protein [Ehrlichia ruminantium]GAT78637.1 ankyrin repeat-containing protein [Ehrlichia ruminantium]